MRARITAPRTLLKSSISLAVMIMLLSSVRVMADWRSYVWTYEYQTIERGGAEFESYLTLSTPESDRMSGITTAEHQFELEVGMTDRFDFAIYQVFKQPPGETLEYDEYKLRGRYRFGEKGAFALDPLIYLEYIGKPDFSAHEFELKLILARDFDKFNFAANPRIEFASEDDDWETELGYAAGATYRLTNFLKAGVEAKGNDKGHYIGPVISHGRHDLWATLGTAFAVSHVDDNRPKFQARLLLGVGL